MKDLVKRDTEKRRDRPATTTWRIEPSRDQKKVFDRTADQVIDRYSRVLKKLEKY